MGVQRTWQAAGYRSGAADAKGKLARVYAAQGRYEAALGLFTSCIEEMDDIGSRADALEASARMAECRLLQRGRHRGTRPGGPLPGASPVIWRRSPQTPLIQRVRGRHWPGSARPEAIEAWRQSLQAARSRGAEYEVALTERAAADARLRPSWPPAATKSRG